MVVFLMVLILSVSKYVCRHEHKLVIPYLPIHVTVISNIGLADIIQYLSRILSVDFFAFVLSHWVVKKKYRKYKCK